MVRTECDSPTDKGLLLLLPLARLLHTLLLPLERQQQRLSLERLLLLLYGSGHGPGLLVTQWMSLQLF